MCFNRTFMELKLMSPTSMGSSSLCFNRTFMELKSSTPEAEPLHQ